MLGKYYSESVALRVLEWWTLKTQWFSKCQGWTDSLLGFTLTGLHHISLCCVLQRHKLATRFPYGSKSPWRAGGCVRNVNQSDFCVHHFSHVFHKIHRCIRRWCKRRESLFDSSVVFSLGGKCRIEKSSHTLQVWIGIASESNGSPWKNSSRNNRNTYFDGAIIHCIPGRSF